MRLRKAIRWMRSRRSIADRQWSAGTERVNANWIGITINAVGLRLAALAEDQRPAKVLVVIVTDGMENASREYKREQIEAMVKIQTERYSWEFAYLGANQDAFSVAAGIGVKTANVATYQPTRDGAHAAMSVLDASVARSRGGGDMSIGQCAYDAALARGRGGRP